MSKQRAIRILNAEGGSFTSRAQAVKLLKRGRAVYIDERTIELVAERAPEARSNVIEFPAPVSHSPRLAIVPAVYAPEASFGQTFLRYPQRTQTSTRRLTRAA
jgi:hypothetical protein